MEESIIMEENMIMIRYPKIFCLSFDWPPKHVYENLKHGIESIIKSNGPLAENKIKNEIEQWLLTYKHGSNIHEYGKLQNKWTT